MPVFTGMTEGGEMTMPAQYTVVWFWLQVGQMIATVIVGIYVWWTNREKVTNSRFTNLEKDVAQRPTWDDVKKRDKDRSERCNRHDVRIKNVESDVLSIGADVKHLPSHKDFERLSDRIGALDHSLGEFAGRLTGLNRAVDLINEFLITQGGKSSGGTS